MGLVVDLAGMGLSPARVGVNVGGDTTVVAPCTLLDTCTPAVGDQLLMLEVGGNLIGVGTLANRAGPVTTVTKVSSGGLTLTAAYQDVPGLTTSVTVGGANAFGICWWTLGVSCTASVANSYCQGDLFVDGASQNSNGSLLTPMSSTYAFWTNTKVHTFALASGAARVVKCQAKYANGVPTGTVVIGHSSLTLLVVDR
jgi:hypothetical protein